MKFVKGDAIAGLLITILNITAGLALGITQQGLSIIEAIQKYSLLTVGDGLVSQIPALLVAVAAGIAVSRVADTEDSFVGRDIIRQMTRDPRVLSVTAFVLLGLSLVPSLPTFLFLSAAILLTVVGYQTRKLTTGLAHNEVNTAFKPKVYSALVIKLSADAAVELQRVPAFVRKIQEIRQHIFQSWGIIIPEIEIDIDLSATGLYAGLYLNNIKEFEYISPVNETKFVAILLGHLDEFIKSHLVAFVNDTQVRLLMEAYACRCDDLINSVVPDVVPITGVTTLVRELLQEDISIKEFPAILQAIAEYKFKSEGGNLGTSSEINSSKVLKQISAWDKAEVGSQKNADLLAEVRIALKRTICEGLVLDNHELNAIVVSPLLDRVFSVAGFNQAPVATSLVDQLKDRLNSFIEEIGEEHVVVVSSKFARLCLAQAIRPSFRKLKVLAHDEITDDMKINILGVVGGDSINRDEVMSGIGEEPIAVAA